jgi:hypothetical protein
MPHPTITGFFGAMPRCVRCPLQKRAQASASKRKQAQASASKRKLFHGMSDSGHAMLSVVNQATEGESRREIKP